MSSPNRQLQSTLLAMIVLQTVGTVDTRRRMPAPKQFAAIGIVWGILFLAADFGQGRLAAKFSILLLLPTMVLGPFGKRFVTWLETAAEMLQTSPTATDAGSTSSAPGSTGGASGSAGSSPDTGSATFPAPVAPMIPRFTTS